MMLPFLRLQCDTKRGIVVICRVCFSSGVIFRAFVVHGWGIQRKCNVGSATAVVAL